MKRNPVAWAALVVSTAALVSSSGILRPMPAAPRVAPESSKTAEALSQAYESVAEFVRPSVVQISVQKKAAGRLPNMRRFPFPNPNNPNGRGPLDPKDLEDMLRKFFGPEGTPEKEQIPRPGGGVGSGFVFDNKGHVLTNNHVVEGAEKIVVAFHDGVEVEAKVVGRDDKSDVAVIKVDNTSYPPLPKGDSLRLKVGELVMAVGSPFELSQSVTTGIISATERNNVNINAYESFLQTDAPINPGNSGGPLVNMKGEVVGINSAIVTGGRGGFGGGGGNDGIGFAIPIDMATTVADQLIRDGKVTRSRIGVVLAPLDAPLARKLGVDPSTKGVVAADVVEDSPAAKAGLKEGDVIVGFGGDKISSLPGFRLKVASSEAGKPFELEYYREGQKHTTTIVPALEGKVRFAMEGTESEPKVEKPVPAKTAIGDFGLEVQPLTAELTKSLGLAAEAKGLLVSSVKEGSPADEHGLREGDLITKLVKDKKVVVAGSVKEFQELGASSDEISFIVQSGKLPGRFVTLTKSKK